MSLSNGEAVTAATKPSSLGEGGFCEAKVGRGKSASLPAVSTADSTAEKDKAKDRRNSNVATVCVNPSLIYYR